MPWKYTLNLLLTAAPSTSNHSEIDTRADKPTAATPHDVLHGLLRVGLDRESLERGSALGVSFLRCRLLRLENLGCQLIDLLQEHQLGRLRGYVYAHLPERLVVRHAQEERYKPIAI